VLESGELDGWRTAYIAAEHLTLMVVSALGFALGSGYSVELIQVVEEDGTPHVFGVRPGGLDFTPSDPILNRALRLAAENVFFRLALRDYVRAIADVSDCAFYCYRSIESVKNSFVPSDGRGSWDEMHAALGTSRDEIDRRVKAFADPVRHGNWVAAPSTDAATRHDILLCTRDVLSKFLDHARPAA